MTTTPTSLEDRAAETLTAVMDLHGTGPGSHDAAIDTIRAAMQSLLNDVAEEVRGLHDRPHGLMTLERRMGLRDALAILKRLGTG